MQGDGKIISNTHPSLARIFTAITFALLATPKRSPTAVALCVVMIYIERDVVSLGYSPRKDHLRNVCSVTVAIDVFITDRNSLSPLSATLKVHVVNVGACIDDVRINALARYFRVQVFVEGAEAKTVTMGETGKAPRSILLELGSVLPHSVDFRVELDVINLSST